MAGKIYMIKGDDELIAMNEKKHASELNFQKLIMKYPDLIPGDQIDSEKPRRWLFVGEEVHFPVVGGRTIRLDLLFMDQDGVPTLIELKRSEDDRLKSEVATQIMEYGANILLSMDTRSIKKMVESNNDISVSEFLDDDDSEEEFWEKVYDNLKAEKIRLLVVADEIPNRLQNIIEFLNRNMESVTILAVEIKQYTKDETKTLVSRVIGQSIEAQSKKTGRTGSDPVLDKNTFFENLDSCGKDFFEVLFDFARQNELVTRWGTKGFSLNVDINGNMVSLMQGYCSLSAYDQVVFSKIDSIQRKVNDADKIIDEYLKVLELDNFDKVGNGFKLNIDQELNEKQLEEFKKILINIIREIRANGLK